MVNAMLIKKIQYDNLRFVKDKGSYAAVVILTTNVCTMCLQAKAPGEAGMIRSEIAVGLMRDALRQVHQLPEYRTGREKITVADYVTQEFRQTA